MRTRRGPRTQVSRAAPMPGPDRRDQLIGEARRMLEEEGVEGLSLRDIAKHAGVSRQTPYIYFQDGVTEVIAAVADEAFRQLATALEGASGHDAREALIDLSLRYIRFGIEHPHLYRAMFHAILKPRLRDVDNPVRPSGDKGYETYRKLASSKDTAWRLIELAVAALKGKSPEAGVSDPESLAVAALLHGVVGEYIDEGLEEEIREKATSMIEVVIRGIESAVQA